MGLLRTLPTTVLMLGLLGLLGAASLPAAHADATTPTNGAPIAMKDTAPPVHHAPRFTFSGHGSGGNVADMDTTLRPDPQYPPGGGIVISGTPHEASSTALA